MEKLNKKGLIKINGGIGVKTLFGDNIRDMFGSYEKLEIKDVKRS